MILLFYSVLYVYVICVYLMRLLLIYMIIALGNLPKCWTMTDRYWKNRITWIFHSNRVWGERLRSKWKQVGTGGKVLLKSPQQEWKESCTKLWWVCTRCWVWRQLHWGTDRLAGWSGHVQTKGGGYLAWWMLDGWRWNCPTENLDEDQWGNVCMKWKWAWS